MPAECRDLPFDDLRCYKDMRGKVVEDSGGMKNDMDKPDWSLIPLDIIEGIVRVLTYGAKKYARDNWKKVSVNRNFAALLRHLTKWQAGEEFDPESGLHHLDHAMCDLMFIKWRIEARMAGRLPIDFKEDKETLKWKYGEDKK